MIGQLVTPLLDDRDCEPLEAEGGEYVATSDLAHRIETWLQTSDDRNYHQLAREAGVSARAISKILDGSRPYQTLYLADALMLAMGHHVSELETIRRNPWKRES